MSERWLWWAKRDLRLYDNAAIRHLVDSDHECLTLFVFEPSLGSATETSVFHALALYDALDDLKHSFRSGYKRCSSGPTTGNRSKRQSHVNRFFE